MSSRANGPGIPGVRITFVLESAEYGGAEAYVLHLLRHLPAGFEPTVVATHPTPARLVSETARLGVPLVTVTAVRGKFDVPRLIRQAKVVLATGPDLVHVNLPTVGHSRHVLGALALIPKPIVATLHLVVPIHIGFQKAILRLAYGRLSRLIAVSEETKRQLCSDLHVDENVVRVIANGVETLPLADAPSSQGRPIKIGGMGRLTRQKGFDLLIAATRRLIDEGHDVAVVICGEGSDREALEREAAGLPVEFRGVIADVPAFLEELDVFCLPSRWEGLPFALLEAMMAGLPCVAANVGDVGTALDGTGIVIPPNDVDALRNALRSLMADTVERTRLGTAAHARAKAHFSVEAMVKATVGVYREVLT
jgi:glycosyltransferase involved in cell wall biosynthesis